MADLESARSPKLLHDRYRWPYAILRELRWRDSQRSIRAADLVVRCVQRDGLAEINASYARELISALRAGGAPIESARSAGYWWGGDL